MSCWQKFNVRGGDCMKIACFAGVKYGEKLIFSSFYFNALCEMDLKTYEIKMVGIFTEELMYSRLHRQAFLYGEEAWFIPQRAKYIACVNLESYEIKYYDVLFHENNKKNIKYIDAVYRDGCIVNERYLCLNPRDIDSVTIIDMLEHKLIPFYGIKLSSEDRIAAVYFANGKIHLLMNNSSRTVLLDILEQKVSEMNLQKIITGSSYVIGESETWFAERELTEIMKYRCCVL